MDVLKKRILENKYLVLSLDLDDTVVNRKKGDNFVTKENIILLKTLLKKKNVTVLFNTGRERFGYESFCHQFQFTMKNAVIGSGATILSNGQLTFDENASIEKVYIDAILSLIQNNHIPFADFSQFYDRTIIHNYDEYSTLFFAQNPIDFFTDSLSLLDLPLKKYVLKRKSNFKKKLEDKIQFARLEVDEKIVNKGTGLSKWFSNSSLPLDDTFILHIGDKDSGLVNDSIIKTVIPESFLLMVGSDFEKKNSLVNFYIEGDVDCAIASVLQLIDTIKQ